MVKGPLSSALSKYHGKLGRGRINCTQSMGTPNCNVETLVIQPSEGGLSIMRMPTLHRSATVQRSSAVLLEPCSSLGLLGLFGDILNCLSVRCLSLLWPGVFLAFTIVAQFSVSRAQVISYLRFTLSYYYPPTPANRKSHGSKRVGVECTKPTWGILSFFFSFKLVQ